MKFSDLNKYLTIITITFIFSCREDKVSIVQKDEDGVFISQEYLWKKSLHEGGKFNSNSEFREKIQYNNNVAIPTTDANGNRYMSMINSSNGEIIWKWNDIEGLSTNYVDISGSYINNNLLTYQWSSWSMCINLDNGATVWKKNHNRSFGELLTGIGDTYFLMGESENMYPQYDERVGFKCNLQTGELEEFLIPNFSLDYILNNRIGRITAIEPYTINNVQHLAIIYQEPASLDWDFQSFLGLFNYETKQWVYEHIILNEPVWNGVLLATPKIYNDKIYANIGKYLICHDLLTGKRIWKKELHLDFMFSGFIIEEGRIIANNEDLTLLCLDPESGGTIWVGEGAGTSSRLTYFKGIVYFVGGSSGMLHAVDISNGETVWRIDAKKLEGSKALFKTNAVYAIPAINREKDKIIALSHMYAYCFEAYQ